MSKVQSISDPGYVNKQYQNASNLNVRIRLHQEFSTNKYGWQRWLFDRFQIKPPCRVLELGCGAGNLWLENLDRLPDGLEIVLSDFSPGMLEQARFNLNKASTPFKFKVIDAQSIPFESQCFDVVIANHMLYHVPDIRRALLEIKRVLKPDGRFYASTIGEKHLKEMHDLMTRFDPELPSWGTLPSGSFTLDNGAEQLRQCFKNVSLERYIDSLVVTDAGLLVDYILSGRLKISPDQKSDLAKFVEKEFEENGGQFFITKESGVFESTKS